MQLENSCHMYIESDVVGIYFLCSQGLDVFIYEKSMRDERGIYFVKDTTAQVCEQHLRYKQILFPNFRQNVETHEMNYCFYKRNNMRHYEEYTNSCHEGTNKGIKYNSAPVLPGHSLAKSCMIMSKNGERMITKKKY